MVNEILVIHLDSPRDIVRSRQHTRWIGALMGFGQTDQTQIAAAVSEAARHALVFAKGGRIHFRVLKEAEAVFEIQISDHGPGIEDVGAFLSSEAGAGLRACHRLMDACTVRSTLGQGSDIILRKKIPNKDGAERFDVHRIRSQLSQVQLENAVEDKHLEDKEILNLIDESRLNHRQMLIYQAQLEDLNKELADTNRGVIALNIELENQARTVREASEIKQTFLSHITHELRTPLNSILSMSKILSICENLSEEGKKQLGFILSAAHGLSQMVNDLLDNVKADSGKWDLEISVIHLSELFDMQRAMFRPLLPTDRRLELIFDDVRNIPPFLSDEGKLNQILRNFISNALKFTETGQIHVSAFLHGTMLRISVEDSGIGIPPEYQALIFEDFTQVRSPHQSRSKGTGLGLPLARKLARLVNGSIALDSQLGKGSVFSVEIPITLATSTSPAE